MSSCHSHKSFIFTLLFPVFVLSFVISSPIPTKSPYDAFINFLLQNNCSMPKEIKLPFQKPSTPSPFDYLFLPLSECRTPNALKQFDEANMLCREVFDVLKNITCAKYDDSLSVIASDNLSENVCHDFESLKDILPQKDNYLSGRLTDKLTCKVLCSAERYELLCKTLLWSYDTLMKINHVLPSEEQVQENGNEQMQENGNEQIPENGNKASPDKAILHSEVQIQGNGNEGNNKVSLDEVTSPVKPNLFNIKSISNSQNMKEADKSKVADINHLNDENLPGSNQNQSVQEIHKPKASSDVDEAAPQIISSKTDLLNLQIQNEAINKTASTIKNLANAALQDKSEGQNLALDVSENSVKPVESKDLSKLKPQPEHVDDNENKIDADERFPPKDINDNLQVNLGTSSTASILNGIKGNNKNVTEESLQSNGNDKGNNNTNPKTSNKSTEPIISDTGNENELKNTSNFPEEEDKSKPKQVNTENKDVKEAEKPKETDYEGPNEILPDIDSKLPEPCTPSALPDEDIEHQEDKDQDPYNDIENDGDYTKAEYGDNSFNLPSKNKESEVKNSIAVSSKQMTHGFDSGIDPQTNIGQISEEIAMIAPFPEQEDSHFFFYFLSIVLIIMAGYLIFHNKQKIIALIVEGRHERRRRSHGAGYKKLETK